MANRPKTTKRWRFEQMPKAQLVEACCQYSARLARLRKLQISEAERQIAIAAVRWYHAMDGPSLMILLDRIRDAVEHNE